MTDALPPIFTNSVAEQTEAGEQLLAPFVAPVSVRERLAHLIAQPLPPRKLQAAFGPAKFRPRSRSNGKGAAIAWDGGRPILAR
jgi:hypothetical protein